MIAPAGGGDGSPSAEAHHPLLPAACAGAWTEVSGQARSPWVPDSCPLRCLVSLSKGQVELLSDWQPTQATNEGLDGPLAKAKHQITLLRADIRSLAAEIERQAGELNRQSFELKASEKKSAKLEAASAIAMAERAKMLGSRAWRFTRGLQQLAEISACPVLRLLGPAAGH